MSILLETSNTLAISGLPYVTSSFLTGSVSNGYTEIDFPLITKSISVVNNDLTGSVCVAVTSGGLATSNFITLTTGQTFSADWSLKSIFLKLTGSATKVNYELTAVLTTSDVNLYPSLSSSLTTSIGTTNINLQGSPIAYNGV